MNVPQLLFEFAICIGAAASFAVLFRAPLRTIPVSAIIAAVGWIAFRLMGSTLPAYFFATLLMAVCAETAARIMRRPATLFIHTAVIPLVPGGGLYQTMLYLVEGQYDLGMREGVRTVLAIVLMAMAIGLSTMLFKYIKFAPKRAACPPPKG